MKLMPLKDRILNALDNNMIQSTREITRKVCSHDINRIRKILEEISKGNLIQPIVSYQYGNKFTDHWQKPYKIHSYVQK